MESSAGTLSESKVSTERYAQGIFTIGAG